MIKNIERLTFWAGDDNTLHFVKQELLSQINTLEISINCKGFFTINRQFFAGVCFLIAFTEGPSDIFTFYLFSPKWKIIIFRR